MTRSPDLLRCFEHCYDVFRGNIGQDIVNLLEDEAATGAEDLYLFCDVPAHFVRRGVGQDGLRVAASAPEYHLLPEFSLELSGIHTGARNLDWVDGLQSSVNQVGQQFPNSATAMEHYFHVGQLFSTAPHEFVARLEEFPVHLGRNLRPALHSQIIAKDNDVDICPDRPKEYFQLRQVNLNQVIKEFLRSLRLACQQHKEIVVTIEELPRLQQIASEQTHNGLVGLLPQP